MSFLVHRSYGCRIILYIFLACHNVICESSSGSVQFNESLRDFTTPTDIPTQNTNTTDVKTLQKQDHNYNYLNHKYPRAHNPIRFKDASDSSLSSTTYSRGFAPHDYSGYSFNGFDVAPYEGGGFEHYQNFENHEPHFVDHGFRNKVHDHNALAVKTFLWPLAGIALLGAAAALVTNPILLQLGVVSGRRKRSTNTEITTKSTLQLLNSNKFESTTEISKALSKYESYPIADRRNFISQPFLDKIRTSSIRKKRITTNVMLPKRSNFSSKLLDIPPKNYTNKWDDSRLIPIPLKFKRDKIPKII